VATATRQDRHSSFTLAASPEWKRWLSGLAGHLRSDRSKAVDLALIELANARGYDRPAPPRSPERGPAEAPPRPSDSDPNGEIGGPPR
jgi:hypothetical protein